MLTLRHQRKRVRLVHHQKKRPRSRRRGRWNLSGLRKITVRRTCWDERVQEFITRSNRSAFSAENRMRRDVRELKKLYSHRSAPHQAFPRYERRVAAVLSSPPPRPPQGPKALLLLLAAAASPSVVEAKRVARVIGMSDYQQHLSSLINPVPGRSPPSSSRTAPRSRNITISIAPISWMRLLLSSPQARPAKATCPTCRCLQSVSWQ